MELLLVVPSVVAATVSALVVWASLLNATTARRTQWQKIGWAAFFALIFSLAELGADLRPNAPAAFIIWSAQLRFLAAAGWLFAAMALHTDAPLRPQTPARWALAGLLAAVALAAQVPGVLLLPEPLAVPLPALGMTLRSGAPTPLGLAAATLLVLCVVGLVVRSLWRWSQGDREAAAAAIALGLLAAGGVNDVLVMLGAFAAVPLIPVGFAAHGLTAVIALVRGEVAAAQALGRLAAELEEKVASRSAELTRVREEQVRNEKLSALGRLSAGVAHEINNPAGIALASLQYLDRELASGAPPPEDAKEAIKDGVIAIERIARIVRQLQESGRSAATAPPELGQVAAREVVEQALGLAASSKPPGIEVANDVSADTWVVGQPRLLQQVLHNLLVNAQKAAAEGGRTGRVRVFARREAGRIALCVEDDGPGLSEDQRNHLFEPFFSTRGVGEGMGLGLAVARNLVQAMRGDLTVAASGPGRTVFAISLEAVETPALGVPRPTPFPTRGRRPQVLVIDDDSLVRRAIVRQLSGKYEVATVETVAEGLALIEGEPTRFAAVLCDIVMPDGGGRTFLPEVRKRWPALESRTIFITGGTTSDLSDAFYDAHFEKVLQKPIDTAKLHAALAACVGEPRAPGSVANGSKNHA